MAVLQAYQADLLKELDEGKEIKSEDISELRWTADLWFADLHLWLTLSDMREKDRVCLMDDPLAPSGLFDDAVKSVVDRYQARKQAAAFQRFLPHRSRTLGAAGREHTSSSYREAQKQSVASCAPPQRGQEQRHSKPGTAKLKTDMRAVLQARKSSAKKSWHVWLRTSEGGPYWGRAAYTASHGARLASVPSGNRSANSANVPGRSCLQRALLSVSSARKRSGAERLATSSEVSRAARSAVPCRCATSGHRFSCSNYTRDQSREADSLSRLFSSVETTAKCVSVGSAHGRKRLLYSVRLSTAAFQWGHSYSGRPRAGSGYGTRSEHSVEKGGHRGGPSSRERESGFYSRYFIVPKEGWRVASHFRSASVEPLSHATEVQDAHTQTGCVSDQVRGMVCHDRSKRRILPCLHPSHSQEVPEACFRGRSIPISGSSLRPCTLTPHFHEVCGCCSGSAATPVHPHTELHRRLVDFSSIGADGGSTSRCRSCPHERFGVKTKCQEKCAFSITENHLSGCGVGFDHDAGMSVPCSDQVDTQVSQENERRPVTHCQAVSKNAGSDGSCVQRDTFWPAVHETPTVVAQDQGVLPEGKPAPHDQGHDAMHTCLRHVEETLALVSGPGAGSSLSPRGETRSAWSRSRGDAYVP